MARYGVPYLGSKNKIARWVVDHLPAAPILVDLFAGGCATTHAALESGKWGRVVANDVSDAPQLFAAAARGEYRDYAFIPNRNEFVAVKDQDPYVRYLFSFGNNGESYIYGREIEDVKVAASRMLAAPTLAERYRYYREFIKNLYSAPLPRKRRLVELQGLQRLERLQDLELLQDLERLEVTQLDYRELEIPDGAVVYADPPYRGTYQGSYKGFDHDEFDAWVADCPNLVIVSEYEAPAGCVEIAAKLKQKNLAPNPKVTHTVERLFVHQSRLEEYRAKIGREKLF